MTKNKVNHKIFSRKELMELNDKIDFDKSLFSDTKIPAWMTLHPTGTNDNPMYHVISDTGETIGYLSTYTPIFNHR